MDIETIMFSQRFPMKKNLIMLISLMFVLTMTVSPTYAQETGFNETFDDPSLSGWERSANTEVAGGVLTIGPEGYAFRGGSWSDFVLTIRLRYPQSGEVMVQYQVADQSSYAIRIGADHIALDRQLQNQADELAASPNPSTAGEWIDLTINVSDQTHQIDINGGPILTASDPQPLPAGGITLNYAGEGSGEFDRVILSTTSGQALETEALETKSPSTIQSDFVWVRTGGPPGGIGYDIRYNFADHDLWYVTDAFSGVHISTDRGYTWVPSNQGIPPQAGTTGDYIPVFSLTVDPHDPDIIWAGTQNTGHIYKSIDRGNTWTQMDNGVEIQYDALSFRGFTIDPSGSDIVYAMAETTRNFPNPDETGGVIYKTTDGGQNWVEIWDEGMPSALARYMWIDPRDSDVLYVSTGIFDRGAVGGTPDNNLDAGLGVLKSTDGGKTWRALGKENGLELLHVGSLYMHPDDPDVLLAATGHLYSLQDATKIEQQGYSPAGIYRTKDGGESWEHVLQTPLTRLTEAVSSVEFCPSDHHIVYAGSDFAIYRSEDEGETWRLVSGGDQGWGPPGVWAAWPIDLQCDPDDPDRIFSNNYVGGNFLSEDGGVTWQNASQGYTGAQISFVTTDPKAPTTVYATGRSGIWVTYQGGSSWEGLRPFLPQIHPNDQGDLAVDPSNPKHLIAGGRPGYVLIESYDGGKTWEYLWSASEQGYPDTDYMLPSAIAIAPSDPQVIYSGGAHEGAPRVHEGYSFGVGVLVSQDGGKTWTRTSDSRLGVLGVYDIAIDPTRAEVAYLATSEGIFKTEDMGDSWTVLDMGMDSPWVWAISINPQNSNYLIAGIESLGPTISTDAGLTWTQGISGWQANGSPATFVFDPQNTQVVYMADAKAGVYRSSDGGFSWDLINDGFQVRAVADLAISADSKVLYAATEGDGVYRLNLTGEAIQELPASTPKTEGGGGISSGTIGLAAAGLLLVVFIWLVLSRKKKS